MGTAKKDCRVEFTNLSCCTVVCEGSKEYQECGTACPPTCDSLLHPYDLLLCPAVCSAGCFCPEGTVLHNDQCIPPEQCPSNTIMCILISAYPHVCYISPGPSSTFDHIVQMLVSNLTLVERIKTVKYSRSSV